MNNYLQKALRITGMIIVALMLGNLNAQDSKTAGVGTAAPKDAKVLFDGSRALLDENWTYWEGPRLAATLPLKWKIEKDPVDSGTVVNSNDPSAAGGKYGAADIVTKTKYRDFRLHVEFLIMKWFKLLSSFSY